jgi:hypothetical protein
MVEGMLRDMCEPNLTKFEIHVRGAIAFAAKTGK